MVSDFEHFTTFKPSSHHENSVGTVLARDRRWSRSTLTLWGGVIDPLSWWRFARHDLLWEINGTEGDLQLTAAGGQAQIFEMTVHGGKAVSDGNQ